MAFDDSARDLTAYIYLNGSCLKTNCLKSAKISEMSASNSTLHPGEFCRNSIEFTYYTHDVGKLDLIGKKIVFTIQDNNDNVLPLFPSTTLYPSTSLLPHSNYDGVVVGTFWIYEQTTSDNGFSYKATGYSTTVEMTDTASVDITKSVSDIVASIESVTGMTFVKGTTWRLSSIAKIGIVAKSTYAEVLACFAGYEGMNIRTTEKGLLEKYWYTDSGSTITRKVQYQDGLTIDAETSTINALVTGTTDKPISVGSGYPVTYINPYITTTAEAQYVLDKIKGLAYSIGKVRWRYEPHVHAGSIVTLTTVTGTTVKFPIMNQSIGFDGGMDATSQSYDYRASKAVANSESPMNKKIESVQVGLARDFAAATDAITGVKNGKYTELFDDDGSPIGWQIIDQYSAGTTTIPSNAKGWRFVNGGLYHTKDGFHSASEIAITADGAIVANWMSTGILGDRNMAADTNWWNLDTGVINIISGSMSISGDDIKTGTISADRIDVTGLFAKNITASGTITGASFVFSNGTYSITEKPYAFTSPIDSSVYGVAFSGNGSILFEPEHYLVNAKQVVQLVAYKTSSSYGSIFTLSSGTISMTNTYAAIAINGATVSISSVQTLGTNIGHIDLYSVGNINLTASNWMYLSGTAGIDIGGQSNVQTNIYGSNKTSGITFYAGCAYLIVQGTTKGLYFDNGYVKYYV